MGVPSSEVSYTPAMPRREDHEVHIGHVVALGRGGEQFYKTIQCHTSEESYHHIECRENIKS